MLKIRFFIEKYSSQKSMCYVIVESSIFNQNKTVNDLMTFDNIKKIYQKFGKNKDKFIFISIGF